MVKEEVKKTDGKEEQRPHEHAPILPQRLIGQLAEEIAKTMVQRLPNMIPSSSRRKKSKQSKAQKKIEHALFLDTSAIIDGRIFDVIALGLLHGVLVVTEGVLLELKHIADSQDMVRRERGRKGLEYLEKVKKVKGVKLTILSEETEKEKSGKRVEVDERIIKLAKKHKSRILTCDYNLEKKASIENVQAINVNGLANALKVTAVPGEALHIKVQHVGKDQTQGVGYLDDGTMIVVEQASADVGKMTDVVVSRVIQTATGRILFAKRI